MKKKPIIVNVNVTWRDIERGISQDCKKCPVALSLRRHFPKAHGLVVSKHQARLLLRANSQWLHARLPERVQDFVEYFDSWSSDKCKPMKFKLTFAPAY